MVTIDTVMVRTDHCLASEIDGELVMMDVESGHYFCLDAIGHDIWNRLEQPVRVGDLCTALEQAYAAPLDVITADVLRLLNSLASEGLVKAAA
ncbi:MAG: PqqD family protein [Niveispirillum sp.]|nr:PqqD family protein [Niveispirillum sp.]